MKTTEQMAKDCGMLHNEERIFHRVMKQTRGSIEPYPAVLEDIIGALYRRIECLEKDKAGLLDFVRLTSERLSTARQSSDAEALGRIPAIEGACNEVWHRHNQTAAKLGLEARKVVVEVSGGVAEVTRDDGIEVEIIDHDNDEEES